MLGVTSLLHSSSPATGNVGLDLYDLLVEALIDPMMSAMASVIAPPVRFITVTAIIISVRAGKPLALGLESGRGGL
jgi:hypothetical protein